MMSLFERFKRSEIELLELRLYLHTSLLVRMYLDTSLLERMYLDTSLLTGTYVDTTNKITKVKLLLQITLNTKQLSSH